MTWIVFDLDSNVGCACRWPKMMFLKALGPFLACVIGIVVVAAGKWGNGKGPIKIVKNIPHGMPPFTANQWAPISRIDKLLPLAFIVMAVDMLESTSIARALARKNNYGMWLEPICQYQAVLRFSHELTVYSVDSRPPASSLRGCAANTRHPCNQFPALLS